MSNENLDSVNSIELKVAAIESDDVPVENVPRENAEEPATPESEPEKIDEAKETTPAEEKALSDLPLPGDEPQKKELPKWVEKKLSRKDAELKQREAEALAYKAELDRITTIAYQQPQQVSADPETPKKEQYANEADYISAVVSHTNKRQQEVAQFQAQQKNMADNEKRFQNTVKEKWDKGVDKYDDFADTVKPLFSQGFPENRAMGEAIMRSDHAQDILYFLGQNFNEAVKIGQLDPIDTIKKISELEARFNERKRTQGSKAPAPIESINSNQAKVPSVDNVVELIKNSEKMTQREYEAAYAKIAAQSTVAW